MAFHQPIIPEFAFLFRRCSDRRRYDGLVGGWSNSRPYRRDRCRSRGTICDPFFAAAGFRPAISQKLTVSPANFAADTATKDFSLMLWQTVIESDDGPIVKLVPNLYWFGLLTPAPLFFILLLFGVRGILIEIGLNVLLPGLLTGFYGFFNRLKFSL